MIRSSKGKAKKRRLESKILHMVRLHDVMRDGHCRFAQDAEALGDSLGRHRCCAGESQLAHLENKRRFKTRGMPPELRHTTAGTAMLCERHHDAYDDRELRLTFLSNSGADGEIRWRYER